MFVKKSTYFLIFVSIFYISAQPTEAREIHRAPPLEYSVNGKKHPDCSRHHKQRKDKKNREEIHFGPGPTSTT